MEFQFELLKEAGIHLPGQLGGTIGIVGGLIVGQAAVEAGIATYKPGNPMANNDAAKRSTLAKDATSNRV